jgi:hypothetical protein
MKNRKERVISDYTLDREGKILFVEVLKTGICTSDQRSRIAQYLELYENAMTIVVDSQEQKKIMDDLLRKE